MRKILAHITKHPYLLDQSVFRRRGDDGWVVFGLGGLAIDVAGGYRWVGNERSLYGQIQVQDSTGRIRWVEDVAAELLGLTPDEATFALMAAENCTARAWLEDHVAAAERRIFDTLTHNLTFDTKGHLT
ncbi:hypothetical protein ACFWU5_16500 [Nocardia sp. NPDC058640]|uniref:hypothetical protein n=1 Tax=Nocardia sp. NPDC058640 TaxID=3346571 RepID=UPI00365323FB